MKLGIRLENFKGVFACMWFNIAMTSDRLSFASVEIDKSYSFTLPPWKNLCHRRSRDQPRPGSLFTTTREAEERDPGNEVVQIIEPLTKKNWGRDNVLFGERPHAYTHHESRTT